MPLSHAYNEMMGKYLIFSASDVKRIKLRLHPSSLTPTKIFISPNKLPHYIPAVNMELITMLCVFLALDKGKNLPVFSHSNQKINVLISTRSNLIF